MKRIVTIQDISCLGKCSITVALPVISAMGVECAILPTAVLSTHTMFSGYTCRDLEDQIGPISAHWSGLGIAFDAIYTGYLASPGQIELVRQFFAAHTGPGTLRFVDPAMADYGKMYPAFDEDFASEMAALCGDADVIVPNLTEACFMTGTPYVHDPDSAYIRALLEKLAALGTKQAVAITGAAPDAAGDPHRTGVSGLNVRTGAFFGFSHEKIPVSYHGTGDIFSSATVGALMRGRALEEALRIAADFTVSCIRRTMENGREDAYGVDFEEVLPELALMMRG